MALSGYHAARNRLTLRTLDRRSLGNDKTSNAVTGADADTPLVTVLGIGNPVMGGDGIGLKLLGRLAPELESTGMGQMTQAGDSAHLIWSPSSLDDPANIAGRGDEWMGAVAYIDGGTYGMELLPIMQEAKNLLLPNALTDPGDPGTVVKLIGDQVLRLLAAKLSAHQVGLLDLLIAARLLGQEPERVGVVGVVYGLANMAVGLSGMAPGGIRETTEAARELIDSWLTDERDNEV